MHPSSADYWDRPPADDPVAHAKSQTIDTWLAKERARALRESCSLVVLSPASAQHEEFRLEAFKLLSPELTLGGGGGKVKCSVVTMPHKSLKKKLVVEISPDLVLYVVDLSQDGDAPGVVKLALAQFFSCCRSLALGKRTSVAVTVRINSSSILLETGDDDDAWRKVLPSLGSKHAALRDAMIEEFEQVCLAATSGDIASCSVDFLLQQDSKAHLEQQVQRAFDRNLRGADISRTSSSSEDDDDEPAPTRKQPDDGFPDVLQALREAKHRHGLVTLSVLLVLVLALLAGVLLLNYEKHLQAGGEDWLGIRGGRGLIV